MNSPHRVVIATRESPLALWQAEHVQGLLRQQGAAGRTARHDDARRPDSRPHAVEGRRQGPVRQGTRGRAARGARRSRRAFPEGRADGTAARVRTGGRDDARRPARLRRVHALCDPGRDARRRPHRHLEPAPRADAARALPAPVDPVDPRQRRYPAREARPRRVRRARDGGRRPETARTGRPDPADHSDDRVAAGSRARALWASRCCAAIPAWRCCSRR